MKRIIFLILIGVLFISPVLAADYPVINGLDINRSDVTASDFVLYLFYLITAIGAFMAVILLIVAALEWVSAYGDAGAINSAKKKIITVFTGLVVLLGSYIALNTINPQLLNVNIDDISNQDIQTELVIPEGSGIFLYSEAQYKGESVTIKSSKTNLIDDGFFRKAVSIKIKSNNLKLGAILFGDREVDGENIPGTEFKGRCSYITSDIHDLGSASGDQNNPIIGQNNLASLIVFNGSPSGSIGIYSTYNCQPKINKYCREQEECDDDEECEEWEDPYPCPPEEEYFCSLNNINKFTKIEEAIERDCKNDDGEITFKGDILSIGVGDQRKGVLFRGLEIKDNDEPQEICQYFDSRHNNCINMVKYGPFYRIIDGENSSIFLPKEIMVFSLD